MKLITKYNRVNIIATIQVLLIGSTCYYFIIRFVLIKQLDNTLKVEEAEITAIVRTRNSLPEASRYRDQMTLFTEVDGPRRRKFSNITLYDSAHHEFNPYRHLQFPLNVNGKYFLASVTKSETETEDLLILIVIITMAVIVLLLLMLFLANRVLLRKIWQPFYHTLQSIRDFHISSRQAIKENSSEIDEFRYLDKALNEMTGRLVREYERVRIFADNASHEMQTPLAIINSKLDLLIQDQGLQEKQMKQLQEMYDAVGRMSKLNQSLLLLTKIDNNQFVDAETLDLAGLITHKLRQMEDITNDSNLEVTLALQPVTLALNGYLADILLNNLVGNCFHHNVPGGKIDIELTTRRLTIRNTGPALSFDASAIFERFKKSDRSQGTGLGLAIVKQICDSLHYTIRYGFEQGMHTFTIDF